MEFANPRKGEPPDDFSADNSYRQTANERRTVGFFYALVFLGSTWQRNRRRLTLLAFRPDHILANYLNSTNAG